MEEKEEAETKVVCGYKVFASIDDMIFDYFVQVQKEELTKLLMSI